MRNKKKVNTIESDLGFPKYNHTQVGEKVIAPSKLKNKPLEIQ